MPQPLRVCLFNQGGIAPEVFRAPFAECDALKLVAECATWQHLQDFLGCDCLDAVVVNLDVPVGQGGHYIVQRIAEVAPDCAIVGVSADNRADTIIAAMRAGCQQFVRWPVDGADLRAALGRLRLTEAISPLASQRICVTGASGGAGATTIACNLAIELAHVTGRRCALVDMDLQYGDVGCAFDVSPRYTVGDICRSETDIDRTLLESALEALPCNVSILARPGEIVAIDELPPARVEQMFRVMAQMFPFVVVDLPRFLCPAASATLGGADRVLVVSQLTVPHLRNATRIYEYLLRQGANEERIDLVLNRCNANFERIKPHEVEKHFGRPVFAIVPNDYKHIGSARDLGHPIMTDAPHIPARLAIQDMARRLAGEHLGEGPGRQTWGGRLSTFFRRKAPVPQPS